MNSRLVNVSYQEVRSDTKQKKGLIKKREIMKRTSLINLLLIIIISH